ncbi:hypothetical protein RGR602_PC01239 (plasmid) [Rhizobium gallicum bv. gallicum R602sp]|uniref:Uncharacterized protein n=1 Tax=Rhizobium gallicum bv. gallicum R602sp TaxID=1041138 RepID=A0A0B4XFK8_9HYPH|nr:hypothetical protein RGR602_PC01239 [Rhizobium gallicum bv. gallicum R602sp]
MADGDICVLFAVRENARNDARIVVFKAQRAILTRSSRTPVFCYIELIKRTVLRRVRALPQRITWCNRSVMLQEGMALLWLQNAVMLA